MLLEIIAGIRDHRRHQGWLKHILERSCRTMHSNPKTPIDHIHQGSINTDTDCTHRRHSTYNFGKGKITTSQIRLRTIRRQQPPKKGRIPNACHLPNHNRHRHQHKNQPELWRLKTHTGNEQQDDEAIYRKTHLLITSINVLKTQTRTALTDDINLQCKKKKDEDTADQTENHKQIATKKKLNSKAHHLPDCNRQTSE